MNGVTVMFTVIGISVNFYMRSMCVGFIVTQPCIQALNNYQEVSEYCEIHS